MLNLAGQVAGLGIRCDLVTSSEDGPWSGHVPDNVRHITLAHRKPIHAVPALITYLRSERPAVLLSSVFPANIAALLACTFTGTPCVIREANRSADDTRARTGLQTWLNRTALRVLYPRADAIIALSAGLAAHLRELAPIMPAKITVIPNPAPVTAHPPSGHPHGTDEVPLVLACGRLEPQKDFATLLEAFAIIRRRRTARMVILGTGSLEGKLRAKARMLGIDSSVEFAGHVDDVPAWMRRASVFALSSRWEGFPNVLLEALSQNCPVVATDCSDAVREVLADGRFGAIVPVADADMLSTELLAVIEGQRVFDDPREHLSRYAVDRIARRYLDVLAIAASRAA